MTIFELRLKYKKDTGNTPDGTYTSMTMDPRFWMRDDEMLNYIDWLEKELTKENTQGIFLGELSDKDIHDRNFK